REEAASALGSLRDARAVLPLVSLLRDSDRAVRAAAIGALTAIGEPAVMVLGACLSDPELSVQEAASSILTVIGDKRVIEPLVKALQSPDWIVRMHAAKALGRIAAAEAAEPLLPLLQDKVKAVREEAAQALASIGSAAVPLLLQALKHEEWLVRLHAVESLGKLKSPAAVEPLLYLLSHVAGAALREEAIPALVEIGGAGGVVFAHLALKQPGWPLIVV